MSASVQRLFVRIGRWPRRIAALICLLLAAGSALAPHPPARAADRPALRPGQVAVPVTVSSAGEVAAGDQVGVLSTPSDAGDDAALVADHLRVLSVHSGGASLTGDASAVVTVATDRAVAVELARYAERTLVLITDDLP
jgi:hypothetical protein